MIFKIIVGALLMGLGWTKNDTPYAIILFMEGLIIINMSLWLKR
jgi:hypothetical protein